MQKIKVSLATKENPLAWYTEMSEDEFFEYLKKKWSFNTSKESMEDKLQELSIKYSDFWFYAIKKDLTIFELLNHLYNK